MRGGDGPNSSALSTEIPASLRFPRQLRHHLRERAPGVRYDSMFGRQSRCINGTRCQIKPEVAQNKAVVDESREKRVSARTCVLRAAGGSPSVHPVCQFVEEIYFLSNLVLDPIPMLVLNPGRIDSGSPSFL